MNENKQGVVWVVVPFLSRDVAEDMMARLDEDGWRSAIVIPDEAHIEKYLDAEDRVSRTEADDEGDPVPEEYYRDAATQTGMYDHD